MNGPSSRLLFDVRPAARLALALISTFLLLACEPQKTAHEEQFLAFGTLVQIKMWDVVPEQAHLAVRQIEQDFELLHFAWHPWNKGPLRRINTLLATGKPFSISPSTLPLIRRATELSAASNGLFNPTIGKLIQLWGFDSDTAPSGPPPSVEQINQLVDKHPNMKDVIIDGISIRGVNEAVYLDFGGFAKGIAVDFAIDRLKEMGIKNAIVNAGGDLRAIGHIADRPWRVGIRNPRGEGILASVDVKDNECIFTSGDYERFFEYKGIRYHHILDPRTGYPARGTVSVTVFDQDAGRADAAATALFVAGPEDWYAIAKKMGVKGVMLMDSQGNIKMTPNLKDRLYFQSEKKPLITYSDPL
ncbi:MAG: FAD:protein FMN transferase [Thiohalomonadales bacterium]